MSHASRPRPERHDTDECLARERERTDDVVAAMRGDRERIADAVLERAQERADAVLARARAMADGKLGAETTPAERDALAAERAGADEILRLERAEAASRLRWERDEEARLMAQLLPPLRQATDAALQTERSVADGAQAHCDEVLAMVAHDLRGLLAGIATNAKLTAMQAPPSEEGSLTRARMDRIERHTESMSRLVGDLLDVVCLREGKLSVDPRPGDVGDLIGEAARAYGALAAERGVALHCEPGGWGLRAVYDRDRLMQVLANLLGNALKFTPPEGTITLKAARTGEAVRVSVLDTGPGIPEEMREAVFERFQRVGKGYVGGGLGLGLYIARGIVEGHGGRLWVEENPAGAGCAFHLTIPSA